MLNDSARVLTKSFSLWYSCLKLPDESIINPRSIFALHGGRITKSTAAAVVGAPVGAVGGAVVGGAIGSFLPGIGTMLGATAGSVIGGMLVSFFTRDSAEQQAGRLNTEADLYDSTSNLADRTSPNSQYSRTRRLG